MSPRELPGPTTAKEVPPTSPTDPKRLHELFSANSTRVPSAVDGVPAPLPRRDVANAMQNPWGSPAWTLRDGPAAPPPEPPKPKKSWRERFSLSRSKPKEEASKNSKMSASYLSQQEIRQRMEERANQEEREELEEIARITRLRAAQRALIREQRAQMSQQLVEEADATVAWVNTAAARRQPYPESPSPVAVSPADPGERLPLLLSRPPPNRHLTRIHSAGIKERDTLPFPLATRELGGEATQRRPPSPGVRTRFQRKLLVRSESSLAATADRDVRGQYLFAPSLPPILARARESGLPVHISLSRPESPQSETGPESFFPGAPYPPDAHYYSSMSMDPLLLSISETEVSDIAGCLSVSALPLPNYVTAGHPPARQRVSHEPQLPGLPGVVMRRSPPIKGHSH